MAVSKPKVNCFFPHQRGCSSNSCTVTIKMYALLLDCTSYIKKLGTELLDTLYICRRATHFSILYKNMFRSVIVYHVLPFYTKIKTILTAFLKQSFRPRNAKIFVEGKSVFKQVKWKIIFFVFSCGAATQRGS